MKSNHLLKYVATAAFSLAALFPASASSIVSVDFQGYTGGTFKAYYTLDNDDYKSLGHGGAGAMEWKLLSPDTGELDLASDGETFYSFCIEFVEYIQKGKSDYALVDPASAPQDNVKDGIDYGTIGTKKSLLEKWYGSYYTPDVLTDPVKAMAFQMGVWEIVYETYTTKIGNTHDDDKNNIDDGVFTVEITSVQGSGNTMDHVKSLVDSWFGADWRDGPSTELVALSSPVRDLGLNANLQDQIAVAVPSPVAIIPGTAGLLFIALRRRRRSASVHIQSA